MHRTNGPSWALLAGMQASALGLSAVCINGLRGVSYVAPAHMRGAANEPRLPWRDR